MKEKEKREDVDEVAWLTKGLEGWSLEFGWRTRLLIWVTRQLHECLITESEILRQRRACKKNEKEGLHNSGTRAWWSGDER